MALSAAALKALTAGGMTAANQGGKFLDRRHQRKENEKNRAHSIEMQQNQQSFQEMMSSTQHQRSIADMQSAGMNPVYAAQGGYSPTASQSKPSSTGNDLMQMLTLISALKKKKR